MARTAKPAEQIESKSTPETSTHVKTEQSPRNIKQEDNTPTKPVRTVSKRSAPPTATRRSKRIKNDDVKHEDIKTEEDGKLGLLSSSKSDDQENSEADSKPKAKPKGTSNGMKATTDLSSKKLQAYFQNASKSPFPTFKHPTKDEAKLAHRILVSLHGERARPKEVVASKDRAGCGDSPSVLDALVRTILSQNTSDKNSTRAKRNMDEVYGGSDEWEAIVSGGQAKLQETIKSGGLSAVKSKVIISILNQAKEKYGEYSLDHLHEASNEDAMREMLGFQGVGPKTASCVLLFCLQRESFAVDTHVHRITGLLGWRPKTASRDDTHAHLDVMIPDEDKYGLHILLVKHGKVCDECKAGGKNLGKCELRKAFQQRKINGEAGEDVKQEELEQI